MIFAKLSPFIVREGDSGAGGGVTPPPENHQIKQMRDQLDKLNTDLQKEKDDKKELLTKLTAHENEKLSEIELLKKSNAELATALEQVQPLLPELEKVKANSDKLAGALTKSYDDRLLLIPEGEKRDQVKLLTFSEGDPVVSLERLDSAIKLFTESGTIKLGNTTVSKDGVDTVVGTGTGTNKKIQDVSWSDALTPINEILARRKAMMKRSS